MNEHSLPNIPDQVGVMALPKAVFFPSSMLPLHVFEEKYRRMLAWSLAGPRMFAVGQSLTPPDLLRDPSDIPEVIAVGVIRACVGKPDGTSDLILQGLARRRVTGVAQAEPFRILRTEPFNTRITNPSLALTMARVLVDESHRIDHDGFSMPSQISGYLAKQTDPEIIGDVIATNFITNPSLRQLVLQESDLVTRLDLILESIRSLSGTGL